MYIYRYIYTHTYIGKAASRTGGGSVCDRLPTTPAFGNAAGWFFNTSCMHTQARGGDGQQVRSGSGVGFRVWGSSVGCRVWGLGCRV